MFLAATIIFGLAIIVGIAYPNFFSSRFPGVRSFSIPAISMAPTLQQSDHVLVNFLDYDRRDPSRGDVVAATIDTGKGSSLQIKRVIAVGGDEISMFGGAVILNGNRLSEPYTMPAWPPIDSDRVGNVKPSFGPLRVPVNKYFVLGDNRDESYDSRYYGPIDRSQIKGKVVRVMHSENLSEGWQKIQ